MNSEEEKVIDLKTVKDTSVTFEKEASELSLGVQCSTTHLHSSDISGSTTHFLNSDISDTTTHSCDSDSVNNDNTLLEVDTSLNNSEVYVKLCDICGAHFSSMHSFRTHLKKHNNRE